MYGIHIFGLHFMDGAVALLSLPHLSALTSDLWFLQDRQEG